MSNFCDDPPLFQEPPLVPAIAAPLDAIVEESLAAGTAIGTIPVSDGEDMPFELTLTLIEGNVDANDNGIPAFEIEADEGVFSLVVADAADLDFELLQAFELVVQALDTDGLTSNTAIVLGLADDPADNDGGDGGDGGTDAPEGFIVGTTGDDAIVAGEATDAIADAILTGAGSDTIDLAASANASAGGNIVLAGSDSDTIIPTTDDIISAGSGDDTFQAGASLGGNRISGGAGNDTFFLGAGGDRVLGGSGDDTFVLSESSDNILAGGTGTDTYTLPTPEALPTAANAIVDFDIAEDLFAGVGFDEVALAGNDLLVNGIVVVTLIGVEATALTAANFVS